MHRKIFSNYFVDNLHCIHTSWSRQLINITKRFALIGLFLMTSTLLTQNVLAKDAMIVPVEEIPQATADSQTVDSLRPNAILLDQVIAIVDNDIIMQSELKQRLRAITGRLTRQGTSLPPMSVMKERILEQLIIESIQLQMANTAGIRIGDTQLNETIQNIARSNNMTLSQFEAQLALEGDSYEAAREQIRREMIISRLQQREVDRRVRVTEQEVEAFLASKEGRTNSGAEYLLGHILIAMPDGASEKEESEARARAEQVLELLKAGEDFKKTAIAKSDGRQALNGGVIGWRKENELPTIAANSIPTLAINEPSELIKTGSGFHIVTVLDKKGSQTQLIKQSLVRHILISPSEIRSNEQAKEIINKLYERISGGDDFAEIAKANSDDPVSAIDGGNLDWVNPGQMVPAFEQTMNASQVGQVSAPFESRFGWHILEVLDRREKDMSDTIMTNQAQRILHQRKYEEELSMWLLEIKGEAFIEIKEVAKS